MSWLIALFWLSIFGIFYSYVGYFVILRLLTRRKQYSVDSPENFEKYASTLANPGADVGDIELPHVSIVIPAYNEEKVIRDKIENCLWLSYHPEKLEIIIASDGSADRTNQIAAEYADHGVRLLAYPERSGKTQVINKTVPQANGEIIVLSDASSLLSIDSIQILVRHFFNPQIGCVSGTYKLVNASDTSRSAGEGAYWKYEALLKAHESRLHSILGAHGAIYCFRKKLFQRIPPNAINDDYILPMKIVEQGYKVIYERDALGVEIAQTNLANEFKRRVRIMAGNFQQVFMLKQLLNPFRGIISFQFFSHKVMRLISPFLQLIVFISNIFLLKVHPFYQALFITQVLFYIASLLGWYLERINKKIKLLYIPFYFNFGNITAFWGIYRFLTGKQTVKWEKVDL